MNTIDVTAELHRYDWRNATWQHDKLLASSPFRPRDDIASFCVWLNGGNWVDMGATDPDWRSGNFAKLLAYLMDVTYAEASEYISVAEAPYEKPILRPPALAMREGPKVMSDKQAAALAPLTNVHPYFSGRGVSEEVQRKFGVGFDPRKQAVFIPWKDSAGRFRNVKYRSIHDKRFWYAAGGERIAKLIYGIDVVHREDIRRIVVCESEIDALYAWSCGLPSVAIGGSAFTGTKADLLCRSPAEEIVVATDNDAAGAEAARQIAELLSGRVRVYRTEWSGVFADYKDLNEMAPGMLAEFIAGARQENLFKQLVPILRAGAL